MSRTIRLVPYNPIMHAFLFDIDGTLLSSGGAGKAAMEAGLAAVFGIAEVQQKVPYSGRTDRAIMRDLLSHHGIAATEANLTRLISAYLERLPAYLSTHQGRVLPGILLLLEQLALRGSVVGLLTGNLEAGARVKLGHFDLWRHFAFGGFGDLHLDRNDVAREALVELRAFQPNGVELDRVWVIGDTPLDIACARAIGARVAAVATGGHSVTELAAENPDLLLTDFSDSSPLLKHLL
jgi:phosphoglycolate phosphatase-like HAD superfamily hydrolase